MTDNTCSVIFRGDIVLGEHLPDVKQKLKKIFNVNDARIDNLFTGKPVPLKTKLSLAEAEKYKTILQQAGIIVSIETKNETTADKTPASKVAVQNKQHQTVNNVSTGNATNNNNASAQSSDDEWQLAPVGSILVDNKHTQAQKAVEVNTDHLSVMAQEGNLIKDDERVAAPAAIIDAEVLDWELTPYGESLLKEVEKKKNIASTVNIDSLSLAEQEGNLLKESERVKPETKAIDTSHLALEPSDTPPPNQ
ncbi:MAG: hypothetical protein ACRBBR_13865 [Cellvibrionaceae bacterium]